MPKINQRIKDNQRILIFDFLLFDEIFFHGPTNRPTFALIEAPCRSLKIKGVDSFDYLICTRTVSLSSEVCNVYKGTLVRKKIYHRLDRRTVSLPSEFCFPGAWPPWRSPVGIATLGPRLPGALPPRGFASLGPRLSGDPWPSPVGIASLGPLS